MTDILPSPRLERFRYASFDEEKAAPAPEVKKADAVPAAPAEQLPLPAPSITERDLQAARSEAHARGHREGYAAAAAKFDKEVATREEALRSLMDVVANRITIAAESHGVYLKQQQQTMGKVVLAVARKVASDALKREPYEAVEALVRECIGLIGNDPRIVITVSPTLASGLRQRIDMLKPMLPGFTGELRIEEDGALLDQDCRVEWKNGYAERSMDALWRDIETIIARTTIHTS